MREPMPRKRPQQRRSQDTVEVILEGAVRLIEREGSEGLTTRKVAHEAGVSIGTLYQYFPNIDAICVALINRLVVDDVEAVMPVLATAADRPLAEWVDALVRSMVREHRRTAGLRSRLVQGVATRVTAAWREAEGETIRAVCEVLSAHPQTRALSDLGLRAALLVQAVEAAVDATVVRPTSDDDAAVGVVVRMVLGALEAT